LVGAVEIKVDRDEEQADDFKEIVIDRSDAVSVIAITVCGLAA